MSDIDWIVHYIIDPDGPDCIGYSHTNGMEQYGNLNFQIILATRLLNIIGRKVQKGYQFESGQKVSEIIHDYDVLLYETREIGRDVLRIILPDPNNRFPDDPDCQEPYFLQTIEIFEE